MIILDTNVVSALMRPQYNSHVVDWLDRQTPDLIWATTVTLFEVRYGLVLMPLGKRRQDMTGAFEGLCATVLRDKLLPFDQIAAEHAALVAAHHRVSGRTVEIQDSQIAGIAKARNATLATRNIRHFEDIGLPLVNPWEA